MKILILSQHFWPESFIINDFSLHLAQQGHEVTIATGKPNYPNGDIFPGYKAFGSQHERYQNSIDIYRVPLYPRGNGGAKNLALNYLSFVFAGIFIFPWLLRKKKFDVIFVFASSPITQAIPAIFLKYLHKSHLCIWVQDLWPESLSATGFIKNKFLLKLVEYMVRAIYYFSDTLMVQSRAFIGPVSRYASKNKILFFPNSYNTATAKPVSENNLSGKLHLLLKNEFCVVFAGNLGTAQSLPTIVETANILRHTQIKIVLIGSGSLSQWLTETVDKLDLKNIFIAGRYPPTAIPQIFELSQALIVSLNKDPIFALTIPSKIQAYMAAGRPIIASIDGEASKVIAEAQCGLSSPAEDAQGLANNILEIYNMPKSDRDRLGQNGKKYFNQNFEMKTQVSNFIQIMKDRTEKK